MRKPSYTTIVSLVSVLGFALCASWLIVTSVLTGRGALLVPLAQLGAHGQIAFVSQGTHPSQLTMVNVNGTHAQVFPVAGTTLTPSPDGQQIAVESCCVGPVSILDVVNVAGGQVHRVTAVGGATWSPNGQDLAFHACCDGQTAQVFVMHGNGTSQHLLVDQAVTPAWAPQGDQIALALVNPDLTTRALARIHRDGSGLRVLTQGVGGRPVWSPDGTHLAFIADTPRQSGLYVVGADGTDLRRLTDDARLEPAIAWSPDSTRIVFTSRSAAGGLPWLGVAAVDGSGVRRLTSTWGFDSTPAWSPDGTRIAFQRHPWSLSSDWLHEQDAVGAGIFVIGATGWGLRRLTPTTIEVASGPVWSPDGTAIVFTAAEDAARDELYRRDDVPTGVYAVTSDGARVARVADAGTTPVWLPQ